MSSGSGLYRFSLTGFFKRQQQILKNYDLMLEPIEGLHFQKIWRCAPRNTTAYTAFKG